MNARFTFSGAIPANLLPFNEDYSVDEPAYRAHLAWLADVEGVSAIVCNGHAAEVASLNREERRRALAIALEAVGDRVAVISGVYTDNTFEAADMAREAATEGAAGLLVFPPSFFMWGARLRPEMALAHVGAVAEACDLPLIVFQYPVASGMGYTPQTLARLAEIPTVAAVKDWSNDMVALEANLRALRAVPAAGDTGAVSAAGKTGAVSAAGDTGAVRKTGGRPVAHLSAYTMSLLGSYLLGSDGSISGMGSVVADSHAEMFAAVQRGELQTAREINDRLAPLVDVFYAPPFLDMHNRMKEALAMLGRIPKAVVRPPLQRVSDAERRSIREALLAAGLLEPGWEAQQRRAAT